MKNARSLSKLSILSAVTFLFVTSCKREIKPFVSTTANAQALVEPVLLSGIPGSNYVPNQLLMKFKLGTNPEIMNQFFVRIGATLNEKILTHAMISAGDLNGVYLLNVQQEVYQVIERLKTMQEVAYAEPNFIYSHFATSNDGYFTGGNLWGMYSASSSPSNGYGSGAADAWANGHTGSADVYVGVIDEGMMYSHEDIKGNHWVNAKENPTNRKDDDGNGYKDDIYGWDFDGNNNTTFDGTADDHGTHVSGTIGGIGGNGKGVAGVNWSIKMISAKFLGASGGTTANAIKAVDYLTDLKTRQSLNIVATNNSWGGGGFSQSLKDAIDRGGAKEILFICAAGNSTLNIDVTPSYPASYTSSCIISVAAITSSGGLASYSNYGSISVDLGAPGSGIYSTIPASKTASTYSSYSGTSMATPHVTGAAALYASINPTATASDIKSAILNAVISNSNLTGKCGTGGNLFVGGF